MLFHLFLIYFQKLYCWLKNVAKLKGVAKKTFGFPFLPYFGFYPPISGGYMGVDAKYDDQIGLSWDTAKNDNFNVFFMQHHLSPTVMVRTTRQDKTTTLGNTGGILSILSILSPSQT